MYSERRMYLCISLYIVFMYICSYNNIHPVLCCLKRKITTKKPTKRR